MNLHYPKKVEFTSSSLEEAWLTIRWKLEPVKENPQFLRDELFSVALGRFDQIIKDKYRFRTELPVTQAPIEVTPHIVRYQFRQDGPEGWPLLQIGPGIASVNFRSPCDPKIFIEEALFLRESLIKAYEEKSLQIDTLSLTYRNGIPFKYSNNDMLKYLGDNLNTKINFSSYIPGAIAKSPFAKKLNLITSFDLNSPKNSEGTIRIATGLKQEKLEKEEYIIFDIEIDNKKDLPEISNVKGYEKWIDEAHQVCHEWFMALIEGNLFKEFTKKK